MTLVFDIDMADDFVVSNIIYNDGNKKDEVRGYSSVSSMHSSRSLLIFSDKSTEDYTVKVQYKSNSMDQDDPVVPSDSPQLIYVISKRQKSHVSKIANTSSNTRN